MRVSIRFFGLRLLAMSALFGSAAMAEDDDTVNQVIVTATRIPTPAEEIASSVTVITAADIEARQERTLPDVLKDVPGLNVVQTGGPGGLTSVFMRGTNQNHVKVLVDGIDVSDPSNSTDSFDFGQFLTQDIERIEVLRGPQSGLYGSDAIGGVINVITKGGNGPPQLVAAVEGGSFDTFNQQATLSGSADAFHYTANIDHFHAGGTPVTPLDLLAPGEARIDDYYDNLTASTKLGYDVASNFDLGLVARYTDTHYRYTGTDDVVFGYPDPVQSLSNTIAHYTRATAHLTLFDGFFEQTLGVAYTRNSTNIVEPDFPNSLSTGERTKVDWQGLLKFSPEQSLVFGAEHAHDQISEPLAASVTINSGYAELQSKLSDNLFSALNVRYDDNALFGSKVTYRFAPTYMIAQTGTQLKASIGSGFKAPTLSELYQNFPPFFFANPNLKPESSIGYDVGIEQGWNVDTVRVGVTWYHNHIHDLIDSNALGNSYANVGLATTEGIESFLSYKPVKALTLRVDYTYTEATDDVLDQELVRRPKHKGTFIATWQVSRPLAVTLDVLSVSSWIDGNRDFSVQGLTAPGYTTVNLAGSYDLTPRLMLYARIDNLLDRHYEIPIGFLQPSLGAYAGVKVKL